LTGAEQAAQAQALGRAQVVGPGRFRSRWTENHLAGCTARVARAMMKGVDRWPVAAIVPLESRCIWNVSRDDCRETDMPSAGSSAVVLAVRAVLAGALAVFAIQPSGAVEPDLVKIAVFEFELDDRSAGRGLVGPDATDAENLKTSSEDARRMLSASGRYSIVDASSAADEVISAGGVQYCNGCEGPLAKKLGAEQSMIGVFTRVSRTEYTLQILVRDAQTGAVVSNASTGLRMGANYSWPRGVKWLMNNRILSAHRAE
jgi:Protein of unknown function (DUF2380)